MERLKKIKRSYLIAMISFLSVVIIALFGFLYYQVNLSAVSSKSNEVQFEIKSGDTLDSVIERLSKQNLIKNSMISKLYARIHGLSDIKAGIFVIDSSKDTSEILRYLNDSAAAQAKQVSITFKEGLWAKDVAALIAKQTDIKEDELITLWNDQEFLKRMIKKYDFLDDSILNPEYRVGLEGYLFPQTYSFLKKSTAQEVTIRLLDEFDQIYSKYKKDFKASSLSTHELVTLSSMIQYEARTKEDMYKISGVFYNRMQQGMMLQSSVTVCYALYEEHENAEDCETNSDIDSPYNTYKYDGLPIGPILNPGEVAIDAALHPESSDYLYFMADIYGDGTVYYAKTLQEHQQNVDTYLKR